MTARTSRSEETMGRVSEERLSWEAILQDAAETRGLVSVIYEETKRKSSVPPDPSPEEEEEEEAVLDS